MKQIKTMSSVLCAITALCGCLTQEDPNKVYTIVLDNGKIQRTLMIPAAYIETKDEKKRVSDGLWVEFLYPSMKPITKNNSTDEPVKVFIKIAVNASKPSPSDHALELIKRSIKNSSTTNTSRHVGRQGEFDVYEEKNTKDNYYITSYFARDKNGYLIEFRYVDQLLTKATRRYATNLEIGYVFSPALLKQQMEVDATVTELIDGWIKK